MKFTAFVFAIVLILAACGGTPTPTPNPPNPPVPPGPDSFGFTKGKISVVGKMNANPKTSLLEIQAAVKTAVSRLEP